VYPSFDTQTNVSAGSQKQRGGGAMDVARFAPLEGDVGVIHAAFHTHCAGGRVCGKNDAESRRVADLGGKRAELVPFSHGKFRIGLQVVEHESFGRNWLGAWPASAAFKVALFE
jgi:hypothetical protein